MPRASFYILGASRLGTEVSKLLTMWTRPTQRSFVELDSDFSMVSWVTICYPTEEYDLNYCLVDARTAEQAGGEEVPNCKSIKRSGGIAPKSLGRFCAWL